MDAVDSLRGEDRQGEGGRPLGFNLGRVMRGAIKNLALHSSKCPLDMFARGRAAGRASLPFSLYHTRRPKIHFRDVDARANRPTSAHPVRRLPHSDVI